MPIKNSVQGNMNFPQAIFTAASHAQKAADYLYSLAGTGSVGSTVHLYRVPIINTSSADGPQTRRNSSAAWVP
jgi:hypothetical protein